MEEITICPNSGLKAKITCAGDIKKIELFVAENHEPTQVEVDFCEPTGDKNKVQRPVGHYID